MKTIRNLLLTAAATVLIGASHAGAQQVEAGKAIFEANCKACHDVKTVVVGPALKDVEKRRSLAWIKNFVKNSQKVVKSGDKDAVALFEKFNKVPMPSFESSLKDADIEAVVAFIKAEGEAPEVVEKPAVTTPAPTDKAAAADAGFDIKAMPAHIFIAATILVFLLVLVLLALFMTFASALPLLSKFYARPENSHSLTAKLISLLRGDASTLTGKHDGALIEDHSYDGIHELDNDLPPWWKYSFYLTIVFGFFYLMYYHVWNTGKLQTQEYQYEIEQAALVASNSDESSDPNAKTDYKALSDKGAIESGKTTFVQNCAACHGKNAEGMVGPNLTDEYWLHGSDINDVFKTIKFGVTSKGMVAWNKKLNNKQILEVASYIESLQGSKPANAKAPQGEKMK